MAYAGPGKGGAPFPALPGCVKGCKYEMKKAHNKPAPFRGIGALLFALAFMLLCLPGGRALAQNGPSRAAGLQMAWAGNHGPANKALNAVAPEPAAGAAQANPLDLMLIAGGVMLAVTFTLMMLFRSRAKYADDMQRMLYTDALTGCPSYKALSEAAPGLLANEARQYALLYLDMRQFKYINDTLGYDAGDAILRAIAAKLSSFIQKDEMFARVYADRFVLLLKSGGQETFKRRLDELSGELSRLRGAEFSDINFVFRCGVCVLDEGDCNRCNIHMACDRANYAKDMSQNSFETTFVFYDKLIRTHIMDERWLESSMRPALERGEFIPYYQPKVNAVTGAVVGAEALVRWNHPERGLLSPAVFIPFFEKTGFIVHIDFAIFTEVCRTLREWMDAGKTQVPVSVNFSRRHIGDTAFADKVKALADGFGVPTGLLEIEITETVALDDLDMAARFVKAVKANGFLLSIDDFGTGYSSLSFLQKLPMDVLKLDKSFVANAMQSKKARDIMWHLVTAVRENKIRVLCEGIENEEQRDFIISQNCCFAQGYLYSKPVTKREFEQYVERVGIACHDYSERVPVRHFAEYLRSVAGPFIDRAMPGWVIGCHMGEGYPVFYVSPHMMERLGYSEAEFMAETKGLLINCLHQQDAQRLSDEMRRQLKGNAECSLQYRLRKKDGDYIWVQNTAKIVRTEDEEILVCVCADITEQVWRQQEKEALLCAIPGGLCSLEYGQQGPVIHSASPGFYKLVDRTPVEMEALGNNLFSIIHPADMLHVQRACSRIASGGQLVGNCVFRILNKSGGTHWISFRGAALRTDKGRELVATCYNVDGEMHARHNAELVNTKMELALSLTEHAVIEYDIATKAIDEQSGMDTLFPWGVETRNVPDSMVESGFIHPEDAAAFLDKYRRIAGGEPYVSCEVRMRGASASAANAYSWMRTSFSTVYDETGKAVRAVGIIERIDREKRMEQAFAQAGQYREALVASSLLSYDVNLEQDVISRISSPYGFVLPGAEEGYKTYSAQLLHAAQKLIAPEDRMRFCRDMAIEHLKRLHHDGLREQEYEYRRLLPDGSPAWVSAFLHFMPSHNEGETVCIVHYRDIQERKSLEESLKYRASRDSLTGLLNREAGESFIRRFLCEEGARQGLHAFLMMDLDRFKQVNDVYGHQYGDDLLAQIARSISQNLRGGDVATRMGGDEFVILARNLSGEQDALEVARSLTRAIADCGSQMDIPFETGASIGIALIPRDGLDFNALYRKADEAMYAAKKKKDTPVVLAAPDNA